MAVTTNHRPGLTLAVQPKFFYRSEVRQVIYQVLLVTTLAFAGYWVVNNVAENLRRQNIASGFDFLGRTAGFDMSQTLIPYSNASTYGDAFWVGLLNTLLVAGLGILFATILGFLIGIARLSSNWLVAKLATVYVEVVRNVPLLLQLFFWYIMCGGSIFRRRFRCPTSAPSSSRSSLGWRYRLVSTFGRAADRPLRGSVSPRFGLALG